MKKYILSLLILISVMCLTGCNSSTNAKDDTTNEKKENTSNYNININADKNIEIKTYVDYEKEYLIVYMKNNNSYNIGYFETKAIYYDKNGNQVGEDDTTSFEFKSGSDYVVALDLPYDSDYNYFVPDRIDLTLDIDEEYQSIMDDSTLYNNKITTSYKKVGNEIEITITNDSGKELNNVELAVLFMKNNKPIAIDELSGTFDIGETYTESIEIPIDEEKSENEDVLIKYDSIKIVVNRASEE